VRAFLGAVQLVAQFARPVAHPPVDSAAAQRRTVAFVQALAGIDLVEGGGEAGHVAAVRVDEIEVRKAVPRQQCQRILNDPQDRRGPQRHRLGEGHVMLCHADGDGGRHQGVQLVPGVADDRLRADRVGADEPVGPCCSVDPMGIKIPVERATYPSTSAHVQLCNNIAPSFSPSGSPGLLAWRLLPCPAARDNSIMP
jgi:hypothetical protein